MFNILVVELKILSEEQRRSRNEHENMFDILIVELNILSVSSSTKYFDSKILWCTKCWGLLRLTLTKFTRCKSIGTIHVDGPNALQLTLSKT